MIRRRSNQKQGKQDAAKGMKLRRRLFGFPRVGVGEYFELEGGWFLWGCVHIKTPYNGRKKRKFHQGTLPYHTDYISIPYFRGFVNTKSDFFNKDEEKIK
jgi:hypothetical protein